MIERAPIKILPEPMFLNEWCSPGGDLLVVWMVGVDLSGVCAHPRQEHLARGCQVSPAHLPSRGVGQVRGGAAGGAHRHLCTAPPQEVPDGEGLGVAHPAPPHHQHLAALNQEAGVVGAGGGQVTPSAPAGGNTLQAIEMIN